MWQTHKLVFFSSCHLSREVVCPEMSSKDKINHLTSTLSYCHSFIVSFESNSLTVCQQCDWVFISVPWAPFFILNQYEKNQREGLCSIAVWLHTLSETYRKLAAGQGDTHPSVCVLLSITWCVGKTQHMLDGRSWSCLEAPWFCIADCVVVAVWILCVLTSVCVLFRGISDLNFDCSLLKHLL